MLQKNDKQCGGCFCCANLGVGHNQIVENGIKYLIVKYLIKDNKFEVICMVVNAIEILKVAIY